MKVISVKSIQGGQWKTARIGEDLTKALMAKAESFFGSASNMALAVMDNRGLSSMKAINVKARNGYKNLWFVTHRSSSHGGFLLKRPAASLLAYSDATSEGLHLRGQAIIEEDRSTKEKCWRDFYKDSFPGGIDSPEYLCFRFETKSVEYTDCSGPCVWFEP